MHRRAAIVILLGVMLAVAFLAVACGLDAEGSAPTAPAAASPDGTVGPAVLPPDGQTPQDAFIEATLPPALPSGDDGGDPSLDAGADAMVVGDCGAALITDDFNGATLDPAWITYGSTTHASSFGNGYVNLTPTGQSSEAGGIFRKLDVHATSFVASFRYYAQSPQFSNGPFGDGMTMSWISAGTVSSASLGNAVSGGGLGLSRGIVGVAFALDAYSNSNLNDPGVPSFSLLKVDSSRGSPGDYDWHIKNDGPYRGVYDAWRTVRITLDHGKLTADVDGTQLFLQETVPSANIEGIGFTGATGGVSSLGFNVDSVSIQLSDPTCP